MDGAESTRRGVIDLSYKPTLRRSVLAKRGGFWVLGLALLCVFVAPIMAQITDETWPGDPLSDDDLIFVDLDAGETATCGVTAAGNIRCWGAMTRRPC